MFKIAIGVLSFGFLVTACGRIGGSPSARASALSRSAAFSLSNIPHTVVLNGSECAAPANSVVQENCQPGSPPAEWDLDHNDPTNNGFTAGDPVNSAASTGFSFNNGDMVDFKIRATGPGFRLDIYRLGYYQGAGARLLGQVWSIDDTYGQQPDCLVDQVLGSVSCANWKVSARWQVPAGILSGVFIAKLYLANGQPGSLIPFVVRNDFRPADIVVQTSDATWQAYNYFGEYSLYQFKDNPYLLGHKVSYDRPFASALGIAGATEWHYNFFDNLTPAIRWLERNGYNVNYISSADTATKLAFIEQHKVFISVGHDEYWSKDMRDNLATASSTILNGRRSGTALFFLSGNTMFEKTRWDDSFHSIVCYKESFGPWPTDPGGNNGNPDLNPVRTGFWRDSRYIGNYDAVPENQLTGLAYSTNNSQNYSPIRISGRYAKLRPWRNTAVAALTGTASVATLSGRMLGYELDEDLDNGFRPPGLFRLSSTHLAEFLSHEVGPLVASEADLFSGFFDHHLTLYRKPQSGALVFASGTINFAWALDTMHDGYAAGLDEEDPTIQQLLVNLFADALVQPAHLGTGLTIASASSDMLPPTAVFTNPTTTATVSIGKAVVLEGTATDAGGGQVAGIEVSVDGGTSWHPADGTASWSYTWYPTTFGPATLAVRGVDDSGNLQSKATTISVAVKGASGFFEDYTPPAALVHYTSEGELELGLRFSSDTAGVVSGVRFYKNFPDQGTFIGSLWDDRGGNLFSSSPLVVGSATGWITIPINPPVAIGAGRAYVVSYHTSGNFAFQNGGLDDNSRLYVAPLKELGSVYQTGPYRTLGSYPQAHNATLNYFADVVFTASSGQPPLVSFYNKATPDPKSSSYVVGNPDQELGVKFKSDRDAYVIGIRYYKDAQNNGPHTATLYSSERETQTGNFPTDPAGNPLRSDFYRMANTSFKGEKPSSSGWQEAFFQTPVPILRGRTYIASFRTRSGYHRAPSASLSPGNQYNPPLRFVAPVSTVGYDLPKATGADHYFVDVILAPTAPRKNTLWHADTEPAFDNYGSAIAYELGMKFLAQVDGFITGVRFFRGSTNPGPQSARLWLLGRTTPLGGGLFDTSGLGWVEALFPQPVRILGSRVYQASYYSSNGFPLNYNEFMHPFGIETAPLRATGTAYFDLSKGLPSSVPPEADGPNGTATPYTSAYPGDAGWNNYWVEPSFTTQLPPDAGHFDRACTGTAPGTACANGAGRCNARNDCLICNAWCDGRDQCLLGIIDCGGSGSPSCLAIPTLPGSFCRAPGGGLGKCDGAGSCFDSNSDI